MHEPPTHWHVWGVQLTLEVTAGNIAVAIAVLGGIWHALRKVMKRWSELQRRWDLFIRIAVEYYHRTGNNLAAPLVKEYEELYGHYPAREEHAVKKVED